MIVSSHNTRVKLVRALLQDSKTRLEMRQWCLEGVRLLEEALAAQLPLHFVLYAPARLTRSGAAAHRLDNLLARLRAHGAACEEIETALLETLSAVQASQGIIAVADWPQPQEFAADGLLLVLDGVSDPGNVGTILRTALAAGCAGILLTPGAVDLYNPKVVRAAMGAHLRLPLRRAASWDDVTAAVTGRHVWLACAQGGTPYDAVDWRLPSALVIGSEAAGASAQAERLAAGRVTIPIQQAESLNAAAAAAVLCFEAVRQRRSS